MDGQVDGRIRILIVDDHALLRSGLRGILEMEDDLSVVGEAANGSEAVAKAGELEPDVVLMDINMPEMNGLQATQRIRRQYPRVDVIGLTIHDDDAYIFEMVNAGAKGYVLKDSEPTHLVEAIRRVHYGGAFMPSDLMVRLFGEFRRLTGGSRTQAAAAGEEPRRMAPVDETTAPAPRYQGEGTDVPAEVEAGDRATDGPNDATPPPSPARAELGGAARGDAGQGQGADRDQAGPLSERELEVLALIVQGNTNREIGTKLFISEKTVKNHITNLLRKLDLDDRTQAAVHAIRTGLIRL